MPEHSTHHSSEIRSSETRVDPSGTQSSSVSEHSSSTTVRESTTDPAAPAGTQTGVQRTSDVTVHKGKAIMAFDPATGRIDSSCAINANTSAYSILLDDGRLMRLNTSESATAQNNISMYARQARGETEKVEVSGTAGSGTIHVRSARRK